MDDFNQRKNYYQPSGPTPGKGLAIAGLVCGLASIFMSAPGILVAIAGLVLSVMGMQRLRQAGAPTGLALAGIICSIVGLAFATICALCMCVWGWGGFGSNYYSNWW